MKRTTKFLTLLSTTLVCILLVTSFPSVKSIYSQFLYSKNHILTFQQKSQINFNTSYNLNSNIYRNHIRINQRRKVIPFIVQIFILTRDFLIALLNPVLGILVAVCVYLKVFFGGKWEKVRVKIPVIYNSSGKVNIRNYEGTIITIPRRIYKGDSCSIELDLTHQAIKNKSKNSQQSSNLEEMGSQPPWEIDKVNLEQGKPNFLELELSSVGFKTDDDKKQRQSLDSDKLQYSWNCKVDTSGKHTLKLIFKLHNSSNTKLLSKQQWDVKVVEVFGLTVGQYDFFTKFSILTTSLYSAYIFITPFLPPEWRFVIKPPTPTPTTTPIITNPPFPNTSTSTTPTEFNPPSVKLNPNNLKRIDEILNPKPTPTPSSSLCRNIYTCGYPILRNPKPTPTPSSSSSRDFPTGIVPGIEPNPRRTVPSLIPGVESNPTQTIPSVKRGVIPGVEPNPTQTVPSVIPGLEPNPTPSRSPSSNESDVLEPYY